METSDLEQVGKSNEQTEVEEVEEVEARKPASSREATQDDIENELSAYRKIKVKIGDDNRAIIDEDGFPGIEMGGLLDIFMSGAESLKLTESQVAEIRQKNLTLALRQEKISWKIPPSNLVPGQATLRFYKGKPVGTPENPSNYSDIYTISIFQARTRRGIYPGWMEVKLDTEKEKILNPMNLDAAYFDQAKSEWLSLEKEFDLENNKLVLKTKHTGAVGFFDSIEEVPIEEEIEEVNSSQTSRFMILIGITLVLLLIIIYQRIIRK